MAARRSRWSRSSSRSRSWRRAADSDAGKRDRPLRLDGGILGGAERAGRDGTDSRSRAQSGTAARAGRPARRADCEPRPKSLGDLWLQVHRFEDARRAYLAASAQVGATRRVTLGLARTCVSSRRPASVVRTSPRFRQRMAEVGRRAAGARRSRAHFSDERECRASSALGQAVSDYRYPRRRARATRAPRCTANGSDAAGAGARVRERSLSLRTASTARPPDSRRDPKAGYFDCVVALRRQYPLVSLKPQEWLVDGG